MCVYVCVCGIYVSVVFFLAKFDRCLWEYNCVIPFLVSAYIYFFLSWNSIQSENITYKTFFSSKKINRKYHSISFRRRNSSLHFCFVISAILISKNFFFFFVFYVLLAKQKYSLFFFSFFIIHELLFLG